MVEFVNGIWQSQILNETWTHDFLRKDLFNMNRSSIIKIKANGDASKYYAGFTPKLHVKLQFFYQFNSFLTPIPFTVINF